MHQNHLPKTNHRKTKKKLRPRQKNPTMTITITSKNLEQAAEITETSYHLIQEKEEIPIQTTQATQTARATHHTNQTTHSTLTTQFKSDDRKEDEWKYLYPT